jgi:hypothetical protein
VNHTPFPDDSNYSDMNEVTRHHYDVITKACSSAQSGCTLEAWSKVLKLFSYPAKYLNPTSANLEGGEVEVYVVLPGKSLENRGNYDVGDSYIKQKEIRGGVHNTTMRQHVVYPGIVARTLIERDGSIFIQTHGVGYNRFSGESTIFQRKANYIAAKVNDVNGPKAFARLDRQAITYWRANYSRRRAGGG